MRGLLAFASVHMCVVVGLVAAAAPGRAQNFPGEVRPLAEIDTVAPTARLLSPGAETVEQYPFIKIGWCDNRSLNASSRYIKVNNVTKTTSFDYQVPGEGECEQVGATSQTTTVALNVGANLIRAHICDDYGNCTTQTWSVTRLAGPRPIVSLAPYSPALQDMARCAFDCFAASYAQSTVPYFSLDNPRNVTLAYHGDRVNPKPFVQVNVTHGGDASNLPTAYRVSLKRGATNITFLNGETTLRFTTSSATERLAGQFDAAANGMSADSAYDLTLIVGSEYSAGTVEVTTATTLIVVNENDSPVARGWTLAGVQRLYPTAGGALISDGTGSAVYFSGGGTTYSAPAGEFTRLSASGSGTGRTYTRAYADSSRVTFNYLGRMTLTQDAFGNGDTISYDASNRPYRFADPVGKTITLTYGTYGLHYVDDWTGRRTTVNVGTDTLLSAITDPDGVSTQFAYDGSKRLITVTDRSGATSTLSYHSTSGKLTGVTGPSVALYGGQPGQPTTTLTAWQSVSVPYSSTSGTPFVAWRADTVRATVADPGGHTVRFTVNNFGQPLLSAGPLGDTVTVTYNASGQPLTVTDRLGVSASYAYDPTGFQTSATVGGLTTYYHSGGWGVADSVWGAVPRQRNYIGAHGQITMSQVDTICCTIYGHNTRGQLTGVASAAGEMEVQHWYGGALQNLTKDSVPGGRVTIHQYDNWGRDTLVQLTGVAAVATTYDVLGRAARVVRRSSSPDTTWYGYDSLRLRTVTDAKHQVWTFNYNKLGWLTSRVDPTTRRDSSAFDIEGQLRQATNRRGQAITFSYDALHRRLARAGSTITADTLGYSSDARMITASSAVAQEVTYLNSRLVPDSVRTLFRSPGNPNLVYRRRFWYQETTGALRMVTDSGPSVSLFQRDYAYTPASGTLDSMSFGDGAWTRFDRDAELAIPTTRLPTGDTLTRQFVTAGETEAIRGPFLNSLYYRDHTGRIYQETDSISNRERVFLYDSVGNLLQTQFGRPGSQWCWESPDLGWYCAPIIDSAATYGYDKAGNRLLRVSPGDSAVGVYAAGDRIQSYGGCNYTTDFDGNVTSRTCAGQTITFTWSADNRLAWYRVSGGDSIALSYDPAGRLARRDVNGSAGSYFLWDGQQLVAELTGSQTLLAQYSYYGGLDQLHAFRYGGNVYYAQADALGNVRRLGSGRGYDYDESGNLVGGWDYAGFNGVDRARWKGALYLAPEAGLYYMRARWYEPKTGRFLSEDPIGLAGGLNPYVFSSGDAVNGTDPLGLDGTTCPEGYVWDGEKCIPLLGPVDVVAPPWQLPPPMPPQSLPAYLEGPTMERQCGYWIGDDCQPGPNEPQPPLASISVCGKGFTAAACRRFADALTALVNNSRRQCQSLGRAAGARFRGHRIAYIEDLGPNVYGATYPRSRDHVLRQYIFISALGMAPGQIANTASHEEWHIENPYGGDLRAAGVGNACADPRW